MSDCGNSTGRPTNCGQPSIAGRCSVSPRTVPLTRETFVAAVHPEDRRVAVGTLAGRAEGPIRRDRRPHCPARTVRCAGSGFGLGRISMKGTPDQLNGLFVDITDQKAAEAEAELQRQEVTHLMRVSVLGELSGAIAHEVNQPLTAILSNAQAALYLLDQDSPEPRRGARRAAGYRAGGQSRRRGRPAAARPAQEGREPVRAGRPQRAGQLDTALLRSELIGRRVMVETDLAAGLPVVFGDSVQLAAGAAQSCRECHGRNGIDARGAAARR